MIQKKNITPIILAGIFVLMLGLSYAAVPLYDLFCRVTGFGGTTQVSKNVPKIVLDKIVSVRFDTCLLYTSPSPRDLSTSRMPSSA